VVFIPRKIEPNIKLQKIYHHYSIFWLYTENPQVQKYYGNFFLFFSSILAIQFIFFVKLGSCYPANLPMAEGCKSVPGKF
jgi:hypothetical protein